MIIDRQKVEEIKKAYPAGTRIELIHMDDVQAPPDGTKGTVKGVDDIGQIMMRWDTGSTLSLVVGIDEFKVIKSQ